MYKPLFLEGLNATLNSTPLCCIWNSTGQKLTPWSEVCIWNSTGQKLTPWSEVIPEKQVSNRTSKYVYPAVEVQRIPRTCFVPPLVVKVSHAEKKQ